MDKNLLEIEFWERAFLACLNEDVKTAERKADKALKIRNKKMNKITIKNYVDQ